MSDITGALERLADLRDRGILTQEEFDQQKAALLRPPAAPGMPAAHGSATSPTPAPAFVDAPQPIEYRSPSYAPPAAGNKTALFVAIGVAALALVALALWAAGVIRLPGGGNDAMTASTNFPAPGFTASMPNGASTAAAPPPASSYAPAVPTVPAAADDSWLMGQWENVATPSCTQWLRFGTDHTLGDNADSGGTWSLATSADGGYIISMNITGTGLRQGPMARDAAAGTITMGSGANTVTWRKTTC